MIDAEAPLVLETPGGLSVSFRGRLLYSGREPASLPRRIAAACDQGPSRLLLVPSPLLWYGLPELLEAMSEGSAILCIEADPSLAELARSRMPSELASDSRLAFIESSSYDEAVAASDALGSFRACTLVALSGGESLNQSLYRGIAAALSARFEAEWRNLAALMVLGPRWAKNIFDNVAGLPSIAPEPLPRFPGPVIVCGAGPSLEAALPFIAKEASRGKLGVVACDTALGTLLAAGIKPNLVVCLEGQAHNLPDFTCLGSRPISIVADLSSHPATFRSLCGPKHLSIVRITRSALLDRVASALESAGIPFFDAPPLGSVGVHAVHVARGLCEGPLLAIGLDFSFEAGKTHARGCPSLLAEERKLDRLTRWPGQFTASYRDRTILLDAASGTLSDPTLLSYAELLADREAGYRKAGATAYDLRKRGPSIGCPRMGLAEAEALVDAFPSGAASGIKHAGASRQSVETSVQAFLSAEVSFLEKLRSALRGGTIVPRVELERLIAEADYLWWGFPDRTRADKLAQDFLNRLVPQIEYWASRLRAFLH